MVAEIFGLFESGSAMPQSGIVLPPLLYLRPFQCNRNSVKTIIPRIGLNNKMIASCGILMHCVWIPTHASQRSIVEPEGSKKKQNPFPQQDASFEIMVKTSTVSFPEQESCSALTPPPSSPPPSGTSNIGPVTAISVFVFFKVLVPITAHLPLNLIVTFSGFDQFHHLASGNLNYRVFGDCVAELEKCDAKGG